MDIAKYIEKPIPREFYHEILSPALGFGPYQAHNLWRFHDYLREANGGGTQQLGLLTYIDNLIVGIFPPLAEAFGFGGDVDGFRDDVLGNVFSGSELHSALAAVLEEEYGVYNGPLNRTIDGQSIYCTRFDALREVGYFSGDYTYAQNHEILAEHDL